MTARTPLETLTLARDYLDSLLAESTPGPWNVWSNNIMDSEGAWLMECDSPPDNAHLVVALHATAPAIRELLDYYIRNIKSFVAYGDTVQPLAEALLSTPHAAQWITEREAANTA